MKIIIPMAGLGTRFQKAADTNPEYKKPKPFIDVRGYPMVRWATGSLPFIEHPGQEKGSSMKVTPRDLIFIILKEHDDAHGIAQGLRDIYSDDITVITLPALTRGAAETALQARPFVNDDEEIIITDSDHFFDGTLLVEAIRDKDADIDGTIPVFVPRPDDGPKWSYSLRKPGSTIVEQVGEKDRSLMEKGAHANIGAYHFSRAGMFFDAVERAIQEKRTSGDEGKKEFYVAPIYQDLIRAGKKIQTVIIPEIWGLGTPTDLERFLAEYPSENPLL